MSRQGLSRVEAGYLRAITFVAFATLAACKPPAAAAELTVTQVWTRLPVVAGRPASAYFVIQGGAATARLVAVTSPRAKRIELHEGGMSGNMTTMRPMTGIEVPARGHVAFAPGGNHAMIFGLDPAVASGKRLPLRFRFSDGHSIGVDAQVIAPNAPAPQDRP